MTPEEAHSLAVRTLERAGYLGLSSVFDDHWTVEFVDSIDGWEDLKAGMTNDNKIQIRRDVKAVRWVLNHELAHFVNWNRYGSRKHDLRFCWLLARLGFAMMRE